MMADRRPFAKIDLTNMGGEVVDDIYALRGHFVYVVRWPDGVIKAGYASNRSRWRHFVNRGATLDALISFASYSEASAAEDIVHTLMQQSYPLAFNSKQEFVSHTGSSGAGWTECYATSEVLHG